MMAPTTVRATTVPPTPPFFTTPSKTIPNVTTFSELADCIGSVVATKKSDLHPEIRKAGVHVQEVMKRLAACEVHVTSAYRARSEYRRPFD